MIQDTAQEEGERRSIDDICQILPQPRQRPPGTGKGMRPRIMRVGQRVEAAICCMVEGCSVIAVTNNNQTPGRRETKMQPTRVCVGWR